MKYQYNFTLIIFIKNVISNETEVEEFVRILICLVMKLQNWKDQKKSENINMSCIWCFLNFRIWQNFHCHLKLITHLWLLFILSYLKHSILMIAVQVIVVSSNKPSISLLLFNWFFLIDLINSFAALII